MQSAYFITIITANFIEYYLIAMLRMAASLCFQNLTDDEFSTVLLNTVSCCEVGGDDEDNDDDEEDDGRGDGVDCDSVVLSDECSTSELGPAARRPLLVETPTIEMSGVNSPKETVSSQSFCRLEPIASLFHSPHEISGACPKVEGDKGSSASSISSRRPPSVCEVVIG